MSAGGNSSEVRMSLLQHLTELRARLWKCVIAVGILGGASLWFARDLFEILMRPVLAALPEDARALVYTSGIEEINVLLKLGMYAGVFLATPVILYQLWRFIAPGLHRHEKRMVAPFVTAGTLFFLGGAVFCYFVVLPPMFQILLSEGDVHQVRDRAALARAKDAGAAQLLALGEKDQAEKLIASARALLLARGDGHVDEPGPGVPSLHQVKTREALLGQRIDAAAVVGARAGGQAKSFAVQAVATRAKAEQDLAEGDRLRAAMGLDDAAKLCAQAYAAALGTGFDQALEDLWRLDRHLGMASQREAAQDWTRPMLTMREQLSLVLLLEVAFGIIFELPLIMAVLAWLGLVKAAWLAKYQRHAVLACVTLAAIITPSGDAVNLALMAVPMIVCYELGVLAAWIIGKRRERKATPLVVIPGGGTAAR